MVSLRACLNVTLIHSHTNVVIISIHHHVESPTSDSLSQVLPKSSSRYRGSPASNQSMKVDLYRPTYDQSSI
jgi:hypothetical protein